MSTPKLLIAFDGSSDARSAVETVARLFPRAEAVILYARQPTEGFAAHLQGHPVLDELHGLDAAAQDASEKIAGSGAELAQELGLKAHPMVSSTLATASEVIVDAADELDVDIIVLGSRGMRGIRATLLGSTSASVLHHATRATLVIPSDAVAVARRKGRVTGSD
jgi:nucleotide-binding universal stress UspA family protein